MGLKLHGSSTWSSTTLRIRIFSCWRVHETLGKGLTPAGTFPAGGDERSGGSDVEVAFLVATGAEAEPLLRLVRTPREEMVAGKPWWTCRFARGQGSGAAVILQSGYDKTNTAHSLTCLLETVRPELVLQVGVGGAFREARSWRRVAPALGSPPGIHGGRCRRPCVRNLRCTLFGDPEREQPGGGQGSGILGGWRCGETGGPGGDICMLASG